MVFNMTSIEQHLDQIRTRIKASEIAAGRAAGSVLLLAVSKTKAAEDIAAAYQAGQRHFGESYVQEALAKQQRLSAFDITWHFIGPIQSNKTRTIANHFHWVHSVDRVKIAKRLSEQRSDRLPPLNLCLQVNISEENTKSGMRLTELPQVIEQVSVLKNIRLRGVMAIPKPSEDYDEQCEPYRKLIAAVKALNVTSIDTFSLGMSSDMQAAIAEGSTLVRIGTALFGRRAATKPQSDSDD